MIKTATTKCEKLKERNLNYRKNNRDNIAQIKGWILRKIRGSETDSLSHGSGK
jgi:hypothetical protein